MSTIVTALIRARSTRKEMPETRKHTAATIKSLRKSLKMTQRQFANEYGFGYESVRSWEQGRRNPDPASAFMLDVASKEAQDAAAR